LGQIGRDGQNRIRWGNLLTLPIGNGGLLYVAPIYASPGAGDAASSYPRLIRVAMMYNDKVGYGPTVSDALDEIFGAGAGATATGPAPAEGQPANRPPAQPAANPQATPPQQGIVPTPPPAAAVPPGGPVQLSGAKSAALQEVNAALDGMQQAQTSGDFAEFGQALQRLDDAMNKYREAK
jgi:uncharacterized membrane protein (UPF0182 family)